MIFHAVTDKQLLVSCLLPALGLCYLLEIPVPSAEGGSLPEGTEVEEHAVICLAVLMLAFFHQDSFPMLHLRALDCVTDHIPALPPSSLSCISRSASYSLARRVAPRIILGGKAERFGLLQPGEEKALADLREAFQCLQEIWRGTFNKV